MKFWLFVGWVSTITIATYHNLSGWVTLLACASLYAIYKFLKHSAELQERAEQRERDDQRLKEAREWFASLPAKEKRRKISRLRNILSEEEEWSRERERERSMERAVSNALEQQELRLKYRK